MTGVNDLLLAQILLQLANWDVIKSDLVGYWENNIMTGKAYIANIIQTFSKPQVTPSHPLG